jgi:hypothetical protein
MPTQLSPGVVTNEFDLTGIVPAVATTEGAIAGVFGWGPVDTVELVTSEDFLIERFGKPTNLNPETWFTAASFLSYGNRLLTVRAADTTGNNELVVHTNSVSAVNTAGTTSGYAGNRVLFLNNTSALSVGMRLYYTNNDLIPIGAQIVDVFSTHVVLNDTVSSNVGNVEVAFAEGNVTYTAVALQSDGSFDLSDVADLDGQIVKNESHYSEREANGQTFDTQVLYVARFPGEIGNSLRVSVVDTFEQFKSEQNLVSFSSNVDALNAETTYISSSPGSNTLTFVFTPLDDETAGDVTATNVAAGNAHATISIGDLIEIGAGRVGTQYLKVTAKSAVTVNATTNVYSFTVSTEDKSKLSNAYNNSALNKYWEFYNSVDSSPLQSDYVLQFGNTAAMDEVHVVVVDEGGKFTGSPGTVLEVYRNLSRATDAKSTDGASIYYKNVINERSKYIWWANDRTTATSRTAALIRSSTATTPLNMRLQGGADGGNESTVAIATIMAGYDKFRSEEEIPDVSLILQGKARGESISHRTQLANYLIDNIAESRKDCVVFVSPGKEHVVDNKYEELNSMLAWRSVLRSSSYAVADSGYKYMYDKYNDVFRWIPLNGDIAGLCARTDATNDPWWSPAGFNRGKIKNAIRVAFNPNLAERDSLYKDGINPVVAMKGEGILLYGDKTLLAKPSAFDRINVRRLFIVLKKAIARASKYFLFEFNDDFTRTQFRSIVNPYLRDVQGRRGIYAFEVRCDESNNTPEVIDRNEFIGDIYIKPARSINFITLNFVAVRTGVNFSEIIGKF